MWVCLCVQYTAFVYLIALTSDSLVLPLFFSSSHFALKHIHSYTNYASRQSYNLWRCICVLVARVLMTSVEDNTHLCAVVAAPHGIQNMPTIACSQWQPHRKIQMRRSWQSWRRQKKGNRRKIKARFNSQCQGENYSISNDARIMNAYFVFVFFFSSFSGPAGEKSYHFNLPLAQ